MATDLEKDLIYDVGMFSGEDTEFYLKKGFRVVAIEAVPAQAERAANRFREYLDSGHLTILSVAIAENDGPMDFYLSDEASLSSADPENRGHLAGFVKAKVQGSRFSNILAQHGMPYFLKVDIEGSDILCLKALKEFASRPKFISIESSRGSWSQLLAEFALFKDLGYTRFKVVPQQKVISQICPFPAREGDYVDHHFQWEASGMFGEEAPGEWLTESQALRVYRRIFIRHKLLIDERSPIHRILRGQRILLEKIVKRESGPGSTTSAAIPKLTPTKSKPHPIEALINIARRMVPLAAWYDTHAMRP
jgi:FkbM family methyltransferase